MFGAWLIAACRFVQLAEIIGALRTVFSHQVKRVAQG